MCLCPSGDIHRTSWLFEFTACVLRRAYTIAGVGGSPMCSRPGICPETGLTLTALKTETKVDKRCLVPRGQCLAAKGLLKRLCETVRRRGNNLPVHWLLINSGIMKRFVFWEVGERSRGGGGGARPGRCVGRVLALFTVAAFLKMHFSLL